MNALALAIRRLTQPLDDQSASMMTGWKCPEKGRVFVVRYNQATGYDLERLNEQFGDHDAYVDALFKGVDPSAFDNVWIIDWCQFQVPKVNLIVAANVEP